MRFLNLNADNQTGSYDAFSPSDDSSSAAGDGSRFGRTRSAGHYPRSRAESNFAPKIEEGKWLEVAVDRHTSSGHRSLLPATSQLPDVTTCHNPLRGQFEQKNGSKADEIRAVVSGEDLKNIADNDDDETFL